MTPVKEGGEGRELDVVAQWRGVDEDRDLPE
jgi:hypothetical protein